MSETIRTGKRGWKKQVTERCRDILWNAPLKRPLEGPDHEYLLRVIDCHPERDAKIGAGIDHFEVRGNEWKGRTFWLIRADGTETDFSFTKCLNPPTPLQDFAKACRASIVDQVIAFKEAAFQDKGSIVCPVTGETITRDQAHVDHAAPRTFEVLVAEFAAGRDVAAEVEPTADGSLVTRFRSEATAEAFAAFHARTATLRIVSRWANLSILRRTRAPELF